MGLRPIKHAVNDDETAPPNVKSGAEFSESGSSRTIVPTTSLASEGAVDPAVVANWRRAHPVRRGVRFTTFSH